MPDARQEPSDSASHGFNRKGEADAWNALSLVISGMLLWGGVGWLLSVWLGPRPLIGLGLMVGTGSGLVLVWLRYGRQS
jgi:F0F1-type ATP synthase assembly protein I